MLIRWRSLYFRGSLELHKHHNHCRCATYRPPALFSSVWMLYLQNYCSTSSHVCDTSTTPPKPLCPSNIWIRLTLPPSPRTQGNRRNPKHIPSLPRPHPRQQPLENKMFRGILSRAPTASTAAARRQRPKICTSTPGYDEYGWTASSDYSGEFGSAER
jgi:hypothetical protein